MKKQILLLIGLLVSSHSLSAAMTVQKKATHTKEEQDQMLVDAAFAGDADRIKMLLNESCKIRAPHEVAISVFELLEGYFTLYKDYSDDKIRPPHAIASTVLELLEDYFNLKEDTSPLTAQGSHTIDSMYQSRLKEIIAKFRQIQEQERLDQGLIKAAKTGNAQLAKELLEKGASLKARNPHGARPFEWAAIEGHTEIMNIIFDHLENSIADDKNKHPGLINPHYAVFRELKANRAGIVFLFRRNVRSLEDQMGCIGIIGLCQLGHSSLESSLEDTKKFLELNLSRDVMFTFFSSHNDSLRLALKAIGAQPLTHAPEALCSYSISKQEHLDRLLFFAAKNDDELVKALIDEGADVTAVDGMKRTPLHIAAFFDNMRAARLLLSAGASINAQDQYSVTPLYTQGALIRPGVAKLLLESGALLEEKYYAPYGPDETKSQEAFKTVLAASIKRFVPTQREARVALQNVADLIYILGIKLNLPFYVIHEIICFAAGEKNDKNPEWTQRLKRDLEVLYLYKCNGNKLFPLWAQTIRCIAKDPQEQDRLMTRLGSYIEPFLANDTKRFVILGIMNKVAGGKRILENRDNKKEILVTNRKLYYDHLDQYLQMSDFDEE